MQELLDSVRALSTKERKALAALLKRQGVNLYGVTPILKRESGEALVLSYAQQRQWFLWQLEPESAAYHIPKALRLKGVLDREALRRSFERLIARHETLRTTFSQEGDQAIQVIHPSMPCELPCEELALDDQAIQAHVEAEIRRPFDLESGPLLRVKLLQVAQDDHILVLTLHHIVSDGWSMPIMVDELVQLYAGFSEGRNLVLPELPIQYADYALWQRSWMEAGERERQLTYWQQQLGGEQPVLELPTDRPRPSVQSYAGTSLNLELDSTLVEALHTQSRQQGVTMFMLLMASFQLLLHRYSGQHDIRVGVPIANRTRVETESLIGFFINTQVLKVEFGQTTTFAELLQQVKRTSLEAQAHQDLPFEQLVDALQPERSLSHSPLFQALYNHQSEVRGEVRQLPGLRVDGLEWESHTTHFDLVLNTFESEGRLRASLTYAMDLFDHTTVERLARHWVNLLEAICLQPEQWLAELPMLDEAERQFILTQWDQTGQDYPSHCYVHQLFEDQVLRAPDAVAVIFGDQQLTYGQLDRQANRLAHRLIERGVGPEVRVAIAMRRSAEIMVAFLAVLKAGGAYVPLDVAYPPDRLLYMMKDCAAALVLTQSDLLELLPIPDGLPSLAIDQVDAGGGYRDTAPEVSLAQENLAYVIYTSGSTGQPKGVAVSHGPLVSHIRATGERYETRPSDCELHFMSFAFDGAHEGWMHPLINGARVLIRDDSLWLPEQTYEQMHRHGVTLGVFPPVYLQQLAEHAERDGNPPPVRVYCFGGDAVPQASYDLAWRALRPHYLFNGYGPTETVVTPLLWKAGKEDACGAAYAPIGTLLGKRRGYVLDANLNLLPVGLAGELYLGGDGVARGYLDRPGLTAERFVPDPFASNGERVYRSGDLTRARFDGVIDYLGRVDHQVKVRGFRIELGEIEARLLEQTSVREAVVVAQDGPGGKQLVGYVIPVNRVEQAQAQSTLRETLRSALKTTLPDYMVPAHILFLERLPVTPNGKLDRKALPQPDVSQSQQAYVAPRTELEQQIAAIWQGVLKLERVGLNDNFFELGGDSIISLQVVSRARQSGIQFTPKDLFQHQTVQGLASVARRSGGLIINQGPVTGALPLTPIQQWFFEQEIPQRHHWNQSVLLKPGAAIDPTHLQAALQALLAHHDALRSRFERHGDEWQSQCLVAEPVDVLWLVTLEDAGHLEQVANDAQRSLDLKHGPLLRAVLASLPDGSQRVLLVVHHLVVDGVSWRVLLEDLQQACQSLSAGQPLNLPAKTSSFKAWAEHLQTYATSAALQQELAYWQAQLQGVADPLPCDHPQGGFQHKHTAYASTRLDRDWTRRLLQDAPAAYRTQINDLLLTALARVICRWSGHSHTLIRLEGHGREDLFNDIDLTRTVGWFTSMYPVKLSPQADFAASVKTIKEQLRAVPNKGLGYGLLRHLGSTDARQTLEQLPQGEIVFNYLGQFDGSFDDTDSLFVPARESSGVGQSEEGELTSLLGLNGKVYEGELGLVWSFSREQFDEQTVQRLADAYSEELKALIEHCCHEGNRSATPADFPLAGLSQSQLDALPIPLALTADIYPLSAMQGEIIAHCRTGNSGRDYLNQLRVDVGNLDVERFKSAWQAEVNAHDILRTRFVWTSAGDALQVVMKEAQLSFQDLDWCDKGDYADALDGLARDLVREGFNLEKAPLLRLVVVRVGDHAQVIVTSHHAILDGWSGYKLFDNVLRRYRGLPVDEYGGGYRELIEWTWSRRSQDDERFWKAEFSLVREPCLLMQARENVPGTENDDEHGQRFEVYDAEMTQRVRDFSKKQRVTVNVMVQTAWMLLLSRYTGRNATVFAATMSGRPVEQQGIEGKIGLYINDLPMVMSAAPDQRLGEWLERVQSKNILLKDHEHVCLADIARWADLARDALFDTNIVFENYPVPDSLKQPGANELTFDNIAFFEQSSVPLVLYFVMGERLSVRYDYMKSKFGDAFIEQVSSRFTTILDAMLKAPDGLLSELKG